MVHSVEENFTDNLFKYSEITDDYIFRHLAHKIISEITMDELNKIFNFTKIGPNSKEVYDVCGNDNDMRKKIEYLKRNKLISFKAKVIIK